MCYGVDTSPTQTRKTIPPRQSRNSTAFCTPRPIFSRPSFPCAAAYPSPSASKPWEMRCDTEMGRDVACYVFTYVVGQGFGACEKNLFTRREGLVQTQPVYHTRPRLSLVPSAVHLPTQALTPLLSSPP